MKKIIFVLSLIVASCTTESDYEYSTDNYKTMYEFVDCLYSSELFGIENPFGKTYDQLMLIAAPVIMTDTFADTIGEGDCYEVYILMHDYFAATGQNQKVVEYIDFILEHELY